MAILTNKTPPFGEGLQVAIVGAAKRTRDLAPYDDPNWEIWGLGNHKYKTIDRIFEIHTKEQLESLHPKEYPQYLVNLKKPLIVREDFPIKDNIIIYPLEKALSLMSGHLTSSLAYMFAYAILEGAKKIHIYGVDMDVDDNEYFYQRSAMYAWKGYAVSKGIDVQAPNSSLFEDPLYPIWNKGESSGPYTRKEFLKMADKHQEKMDILNNEIASLQRQIDIHYGGKQVYLRLAKIARATDDGININSIEDSTELK